MPRFTDQELESFMLDPREPAGWSRCPFCGADIVMGTHKDTRNIVLGHSAHKNPTDPSGTRYISGCEKFNAVLGRKDVIQHLFDCGARFQQLVPG